eukprot:TRINITY_DN15_c5_g1_i1.p1 TRINITY_DN15_c5_g1~~TRINITY_DN15_c5_g1_i1.p1  ORF type:complete len:307 (+),score=102.88 TRINITY_DN15_c5_g1_i1:483-1403(+)
MQSKRFWTVFWTVLVITIYLAFELRWSKLGLWRRFKGATGIDFNGVPPPDFSLKQGVSGAYMIATSPPGVYPEGWQAPESNRIPRIIHQIWMGNKSIVPREASFMEKIRRMHPAWAYWLWTDRDLTPDNFINYELLTTKGTSTQRSDLMRYEIVYKHGGVYLDTDFEIFRPLDPILESPEAFVVCNEDVTVQKYISMGFFAAAVGNANMERCVRNSTNIDFKKDANIATGPIYFRRNIVLDKTVKVLSPRAFYPCGFREFKRNGFTCNRTIITDEVFALHHWAAKWWDKAPKPKKQKRFEISVERR